MTRSSDQSIKYQIQLSWSCRRQTCCKSKYTPQEGEKERRREQYSDTHSSSPVQKKGQRANRKDKQKTRPPPLFVHTLVVLETAPHFFPRFPSVRPLLFVVACDVPLHPNHLAVNLAAKASQSSGVSLLSTRKQIEPGRTTGPFVPSSLSCSGTYGV